MKYSTMQKVVLTTMALVASLALSAQAGRPVLSSANQIHGPKPGNLSPDARGSGHAQSWHQLLFPASDYMVDDGTAEDSIGLTLGGDVIALNKFAVTPGNDTIKSIECAWGTPAFFDPTLNGLPYTVAIWSDPNGDGNPNDAILLNTASGVISSQGTDTFIATTIPDTVITTTNFFVGFVITHAGGQFPAAFDETAPTFSNVSYVAGTSTPGGGDIHNLNNNELPVAAIESFGLIGNFMIRADSNGVPTPTPTPTPTPSGDILWYNGDFNDVNGLANERDTSLGAGQYASVYDDFNVPEGDGWDVTSVFSNNLTDTTVTGASYEIRQGVSAGNAGTLIASGMTVTPTVTPTGRSGFGYTEFMVAVEGLSIHLDPGTYHLNVTPTGSLTGRSFDSTTSGANCVGTPCGNNQNAFFDSNFFGAFFASTADFGQPYDFSMGVGGGGVGGDITLTAKLRRHRGDRSVSLRWSPADGGQIDIIRDGAVIRTTADDGSASDRIGAGGREEHVYQVCETGTSNCSNEVKVKIPGSGGQ